MKNTYQLNQWHMFELKGKNFVFVTDNLRLYVVDKNVYKALQKLQEQFGFYKLFEMDPEQEPLINNLVEEEMAVCTAEVKEPFNKEKILEKINKNNDKLIIHNMVFQLANDCNLNCLYCYGSGGSYGRKRELMDFETAKKGIDLMVDHSGEEKELSIVFFGGEPLLNFEVIKKMVEYCKSLESNIGIKFDYSMTTNGTILNDEIYNFIKENQVSVMISMDGGKDMQNCYRCYENGKGSYNDIVKNIAKFREARGGYLSVRSTVCRPNLNMKQIKDDLTSIGFDRVYMSVVDTTSESPLYVGKESKDDLLKSYMDLADDFIENLQAGHPVDNKPFYDCLKSLYFKNIRFHSCNAGMHGFALGTDGNIYPCQRFMGMEDYTVGNLKDGVDLSLTKQYRKGNVFLKEGCTDCWARFLCGGSCTHTCVSQENSIMKSPKCYCDTYRGIYEIVLYTYYVLKEWNDDVFKKIFQNNKSKKIDEAV